MAKREEEARGEKAGGEKAGNERISEGRRRLLAALAVGGGGTLLTQHWAKPVVDLVMVPLHAQGSQPLCPTTGSATCAGITFTASAVMLDPPGEQCVGGTSFVSSACCGTVVWKKPASGSNRARLSLSHNSAQTLSVKVDFFTFTSTGCTNISSFGDTATNNIAEGQTLVYDGNINGDFPECTGFRIVEVKDAGGSELTACKGDCPFGDLGIYVTLLEANEACPS